MTAAHFHNWILRLAISSMSLLLSHGINGNDGNIEPQIKLNSKSHFQYCNEFKETHSVYRDTIFIETVDELRSRIRNNRMLLLGNKKYILESTLQLDSVEHLKIVGGVNSALMISEQNSTVLKLLNSQNISIENLTLGHSANQAHLGEQGILRIEHSSDIHVFNCKISGADTFGLATKDLCGLKFENSEITNCTAVIFELDQSRKIEFRNSKFRDNRLAISVLGGFTNSTNEVSFIDCEFLNNQPEMIGNPAFNFENNFKNFEEQIIFRNCAFKNNRGYKWYGEKIKLENCTIDSTDFTGLQKAKN